MVRELINQIAQVEKRDAVYTAAFQVDRLTKPGAKYRNLNPYEARYLFLLAHNRSCFWIQGAQRKRLRNSTAR